MAPRKQVKQATAERTQVVADSSVTPPKKRKIAAKSEAPKEAQSKAAPRQSKRAKAPAAVLTPKNLRSRNNKNVVVAETTKKTAPKTDAASKSKARIGKRQKEKTTVENDDVDEEEKKTRGKSVKKAGTKPKTVKAPATRKRRSEAADEVEGLAKNEEVVAEESPPAVKRATRRGRAVEEENVAPVAMKLPAKKPRNPPKRQLTRRNAETKMPVETDDDTPEEVIVAGKKPRERVKKTAKVARKERLPKDSVKVELELSEEEKPETTEKQYEENTTTEENKLKINMKNSKKRNTKKAISKGKRNVEPEENNEAEAVEPIISEIKENGETEIPQTAEAKQKKKNTGKVSAATNEKIETKKREKKSQTVVISINEKKETKDIVQKDEITKTVNVTFDALDEINISSKDISLNKTNDSQEENNELDSTAIIEENNDEMVKLESSNNELQRSANFLCFD